MSWNDIDHKILERAFSARSITELETASAECGYAPSSTHLTGAMAGSPCGDHYDCFDLEIRW